MRLAQCLRTADFRELARRRLPAPIFHYIDGGADDEVTLARNSDAFECVDLVPSVLAGVDSVDLSVDVLGQRLRIPYFFSPTAMQRLFHHEGERAIARVAQEFGTMFGVSTLGTCSIEELAKCSSAPKLFQLYIHNDKALTSRLIARCRQAGFSALTLTVDTVVAGNRERDRRTGMTTPPRLTPASLWSFATHPRWTLNYLLRESFDLPNISGFVRAGTGVRSSVIDYLDTQLKRSIGWQDAADVAQEWRGPFAIKA
jgi:L-lactate dehydrogenase (cytochrome)